MTKKKRFGISQNLANGLTATINAVKNNAGSVRFEVIGLSWIEVDPKNPRELKLLPEDILHGIAKSDPLAEEKQAEYESLQGLSKTISAKGLINPVVVYKQGEKYRLVAGERRFLASLIAQRDDIQARVLNEKPDGLSLRLLQWIENTEREDLSLRERIGNIKSIVQEYVNTNNDGSISATLLKELIGISLPQATCYVSVLDMPADLEEHIHEGRITNLDKAALIAKIKPLEIRNKAITACLSGANLKQLRTLIDSEVNAAKPSPKVVVAKKRGRAATRVNLGFTHRPTVVKNIIQSIIKQPDYNHHAQKFDRVNWEEYEQVTKAFRRFIELLEGEMA